MSAFRLKPVAIALASALALQGCATTGPTGEKRTLGENFKETFNSDAPCSNSKRNVGIALGAAAGIAIGIMSGDKNTLTRAVIGGVIGAGLGGLIGNEIGNRQCEISKIQKKYDAEIKMTPLSVPLEDKDKTSPSMTVNGKPVQMFAENDKQDVGLSVSIADKEGHAQFDSNSDAIQQEARAMFLEIAKTYANPEKHTEAKTNQEKKDMDKAFSDRRVLLIGHTDDTGSSKHNAELSERRAKAIAKLFKEAGVPEDKIFYQGTGETMPIAGNDTPEGRAKNRRVEIIDLTNDTAFQMYLNNRRPNTAFYRTAEKSTATPEAAATDEKHSGVESKTVAAADTRKSKKSKTISKAPAASQSPTVTTQAETPVVQPQAKVAGRMLDFGGKPFSPVAAKVAAGELVPAKESSFSLISEAHASDMGRIQTCNVDRPRNAGLVKSLKDGSEYKTAEFLPGMYGRTWYDMVGNNLVVLNKVSVLREGAVPANKPELKVYSNYKSNGKDPAPDVLQNPDVNAYQTSNGLLYRVFANGDHGVQCMDILMPLENVHSAKDGKLVYGNGAEFVSDFKPKIKN